MVKTMAESGTPAENVESFIVNNQNVPALPEQEAVWSFSSSFVDQGVDTKSVESSSASDFNIPKPQRSDRTVSSWPPNNWRTAPDFRTSQRSRHNSDKSAHDVDCLNTKDNWFPVEVEEDWVITDDTRVEKSSVPILDEPQMVMSISSEGAPAYIDLLTSSPSEIVDTEVIDFNDNMSNASEGMDRHRRGAPDASQSLRTGRVDEALVDFDDEMYNASEGRDRLRTGAPDASQSQLLRTGRVGEAMVYKYFVDQLGSTNVRWVNRETESGLPYDLVITRGGNLIEYVEVKATTSANKDWFYITTREWQFALEKGSEFTIARVLVSGEKTASIELLKNPHNLCQKKKLNLALLIAPGHGKLARGNH
jgi:hypothetical protein